MHWSTKLSLAPTAKLGNPEKTRSNKSSMHGRMYNKKYLSAISRGQTQECTLQRVNRCI